jgi:hypothetical protein
MTPHRGSIAYVTIPDDFSSTSRAVCDCGKVQVVE